MLIFVCVLSFIVTASVAHNNTAGDFRLFPELPVGVIKGANTVCEKQSGLQLKYLQNLTLWAYEIYDSTAYSSSSTLRGNPFHYGQFEECLTLNAPFSTKYCLANIIASIPEPDPPRDPKSLFYGLNETVLRKLYNSGDPSKQPRNEIFLGWCIPESCSSDELQRYLNNYLQHVDFHLKDHNVTYKATVGENVCQTKSDFNTSYDYLDIIFCLLLALICGMLMVATVADFNKIFVKEKQPTGFSKLALIYAFSPRSNFRRLFKLEEKFQALNILHGIRVFSIFMVMLGHKSGISTASSLINFNIIEEQYRSFTSSIILQGGLFVDSFFILSGLLVTYGLLKQFDKKFMSPGAIIFLRYARLTPVYAFVVFYSATLFYHTGSGPMWKAVIGQETLDCRNNWWTNLLYINNYVNADHMCMTHSWYMPCDLHFFIIATVVCLVIHRSKILGLSVLSVLILISILIPFLIVWLYKRPGILYFYLDFLRSPKSSYDYNLTYIKSHTRATPYFIGMVSGYIYYRQQTWDKKLSKVTSYIIGVISIILLGSVVLMGAALYNPYYEYDSIEAALYASLHKVLWALGTVCLFYTISFGYPKLLYKILAWKPWIPLGKLVYGAYLVHFQFQMKNAFTKYTTSQITYYDLIYSTFSDIVAAFLCSLILHLSIEAPFKNIFTILFFKPSIKSLAKDNNIICDNVNL